MFKRVGRWHGLRLTVDAGCTPSGVVAAHFANQLSDLEQADQIFFLQNSHLPQAMVNGTTMRSPRLRFETSKRGPGSGRSRVV